MQETVNMKGYLFVLVACIVVTGKCFFAENYEHCTQLPFHNKATLNS